MTDKIKTIVGVIKEVVEHGHGSVVIKVKDRQIILVEQNKQIKV